MMWRANSGYLSYRKLAPTTFLKHFFSSLTAREDPYKLDMLTPGGQAQDQMSEGRQPLTLGNCGLKCGSISVG